MEGELQFTRDSFKASGTSFIRDPRTSSPGFHNNATTGAVHEEAEKEFQLMGNHFAASSVPRIPRAIASLNQVTPAVRDVEARNGDQSQRAQARMLGFVNRVERKRNHDHRK